MHIIFIYILECLQILASQQFLSKRSTNLPNLRRFLAFILLRQSEVGNRFPVASQQKLRPGGRICAQVARIVREKRKGANAVRILSRMKFPGCAAEHEAPRHPQALTALDTPGKIDAANELLVDAMGFRLNPQHER